MSAESSALIIHLLEVTGVWQTGSTYVGSTQIPKFGGLPPNLQPSDWLKFCRNGDLVISGWDPATSLTTRQVFGLVT